MQGYEASNVESLKSLIQNFQSTPASKRHLIRFSKLFKLQETRRHAGLEAFKDYEFSGALEFGQFEPSSILSSGFASF